MRHVVRNIWFHQCGAATHVARQSMNFLTGIFPAAYVSVCPHWLARTFPGRRHPQAFYYGTVSRPKCMLLAPENWQWIAANNGALLQRVIQIWRQRLEQCVECRVGRLEPQVIFEKYDTFMKLRSLCWLSLQMLHFICCLACHSSLRDTVTFSLPTQYISPSFYVLVVLVKEWAWIKNA